MTINDCNDADPHSSTFCLRAFCLRAICLHAMWQGLSLGIQVCLATRVATATFNDFVKTIRKIS